MENWVKLRHECSPFKVFNELRLGIKEDVAARNSLRDGEQVRFDVVERGETFSVIREGPKISASLDFTFDSSGISVTTPPIVNYDNSKMANVTVSLGSWRASLTLNDEGQCKLKVS